MYKKSFLLEIVEITINSNPYPNLPGYYNQGLKAREQNNQK